ncbi:MAG TPA: HD domain-containing phosphohydrolase [Gemmatimonadales bacterium]|nr:HD domain-containing phosphohydrolase [Gemmatimonadales bacterium]
MTTGQAGARAAARRAADLLHDARAHERAACIPEAIRCYDAAIATADRTGERTILAEALRRLAVMRHLRNESTEARQLCRRSYSVACDAGNDLLAAEALNTLGGLDVQTGAIEDARSNFLQALARGGESRELRARVEQNLGIVANIQGNLDEAVAHYEGSLEAYRASNDEHGCAIAYANLGIAHTDLRQYERAEGYFQQSYEIAERAGDAHLQGQCLVNHAEVHVVRGRYEDARLNAEAALAIFDQLDARSDKSEAYRIIGMVYRETGRAALAESRLRSAIELAVSAGSVLHEAEASCELALLYQAMGRNQEALTLLNAAHRLFRRLDARVDLVYVGGKVSELETTYFAVVLEWGQSIESTDSYTFGHCERVAQHAMAVARVVGLDDTSQTTIRLGAYLHDLGKVRVPHEILNKPGPLTQDEFAVVQMHPIWGLELLAAVEFPWDLKPIIRWHHERYDGTGYPDRLRGDEIPIAAQIVGIVDVFDALSTARPYRPALSRQAALAEIEKCRGWWSDAVYAAFVTSLDDVKSAADGRLAAVS